MDPNEPTEEPEPKAPDPDDRPFAPLLPRGAAFLIDLVPAAIVAWFFGPLIGFAAFVVYHAVSTAMIGSTLGKEAFGLIVHQVEEPLHRWIYAFLRPSAGYATTLFSGIGIVQIVLHPEHLALHDVLAKTTVREASRKRALRAIFARVYEWSYKLDGAISEALSRLGAFGRLVKRFITAAFGLKGAQLYLEQLIELVLSGTDAKLADGVAEARKEEESIEVDATVTDSARPEPGTAEAKNAGSRGPTFAARLAPTISAAARKLALTTAATLPSAALVILTAYTSLRIYDATVPESMCLLDCQPIVVIGCDTFRGRDVILLKDTSGSMGSKTHISDALEANFRASGMELDSAEVNTGGITSTLVQGLRESLQRNPGADSVYYFSDFNDDTDQTQLEELREILADNDLKLILGTVDKEPDRAVVDLADRSDGKLINMHADVMRADVAVCPP